MNRKCKDARGSIKTCGGNVAVCHILFMKVIINIHVIPYTLTFILLKFHSISIRGLLFIGFKNGFCNHRALYRPKEDVKMAHA